MFHIRPPKWDHLLGEELPFGPEGEQAFRSQLASCTTYLEYGSGSSTFEAARSGVAFVTVESDSRFLAAVARHCRAIAPADAKQERFLHGNIGRTGPWGKPVLPSVTRPNTWRRYPLAPWQALGAGFHADFVLIDGRFRVACALAVIAHQPDASWTMLVDDYVGRDEYTPIAHFANLVAQHGRMAQFRPRPGVSSSEVASALVHFTGDWR